MSSSVPSNLIGNPAEIICKIDDIEVKSLIDTGSQITSVSRSFYDSHFSDIDLRDIKNILKVESAGGNDLPYDGYFECNISLPISESQNFNISVPVLVVPDTRYNKSVPLLVGTNILNYLSQFPEQPASHCLRTAVKALKLENRHLSKTQGIYAKLVATNDIEIKPFSGAVNFGKSTIVIPTCQQIALVQEVNESLPLVPGLVKISQGSNSIPFEIFNNTESSIHIAKGEHIGNLHRVSVEIQNSTESLEFLEAFDLSNVSEEEQPRLKSFLVENRDVFALNMQEMGCTDIVVHHIDLYDDTPFREKIRPVPPGLYSELKDYIAELLSAGVIKASKSPYCSNIVIARKKDNTIRLCSDMRRLNALTIPDSYSIPRVETLIDSLKGAKFFASLDLISGYHQVRMAEEDIEKTAFATPFGLFENDKMAMGLRNAQATFQRGMDRTLEGYIFKICAVYLDDIIVYGKTKEELYSNLQKVFDRLKQAGWRLKPKKCTFFRSEIPLLGFTVSADGVRCSDRHIQDVLDWAEPKDVHQLQMFLGLANFLRKFVPHFAEITSPLTKLLKGHTNKKKVKFKGKKCKIGDSEPAPWVFGEEQRAAFNALKQAITQPPCLAYPDFEKPFHMHCDGSLQGLGCALYQANDSGKLHPVAYGSRTLSQSEKNYSAHKLEFLALKWAVTTKFSYYLYGSKHPFKIFTDHNPLVYLTTTAKLDALGHRWLAELSSYHFEIFYKPGISHQDADSLSRKPDPLEREESSTRIISQEVFKELCNLVCNSEFSGVAEFSGILPTAVSVISNAITLNNVNIVNWAYEQQQDKDLRRVIDLVHKGVKLRDRQRRREPRGVMQLLSYWKRLVLEDHILYIKSQDHTGETFLRLVIPSHMQDQVLFMSHDELGHLGRDKTLSVAQERYFWIGLTKSVEDKIKSCRRCLCAKSPHLPDRAPLVSITTSRPLELVCIDFLGLEESKGKFINILVITDHFTNYAVAVPTKNQDAKTVAKVLIDNFVVHYGLFERLHSDQGGSFTGKVITHMCKLLNISQSRTSPYHPSGNGKCEKFNRSLLSMLRTLDPSKKTSWKDHVSYLVHSYNCCKHSSTGFSPYYLLFGRCPRLAVDIFLGRPEPKGSNSTASKIRANLEAAYKIASRAADTARARQSKDYNRKVRGNIIEIGDLVLVKNVGLKGKQKLADKWKDELHVVVSQPNTDIPVFNVRPENGTAERTLHRNMLLPLVLPWPERDVQSDDDEILNDDVSGSQSDVESDFEVRFLPDNLHGPQDDVVDIGEIMADNVSNVSFEVDLNTSVVLPVGETDSLESSPVPPVDAPLPSPPASPVRVDSPPLRRSARATRGQPPIRLGDYVCHSQTAEILSWQIKVAALLQLLPVFPLHHRDICHAIVYVISHS